MGREERVMNVIRTAEYERAIGNIRENGEIVVCPKCGLDLEQEKNYAAVWCMGKSLGSRDQECTFEGEHLHRMCPRCKWGFLERAKDHKPAPLVDLS